MGQLQRCISRLNAPAAWRMDVPLPARDEEEAAVPLVGPLWSELCPELQELHEFVAADLQARWAGVLGSDLMGMAAVLHPAHKSLSYFSAARRAEILAMLRTEVLELAGLSGPLLPLVHVAAAVVAPAPVVAPAGAPVMAAAVAAVEPQQQGDVQEADQQPAQKKAKLDNDYAMLFAEDDPEDAEPPAAVDPLVAAAADRIRKTGVVDAELLSFQAQPEIGFDARHDPAQDPLLWWRQRQALFPSVAALARKYLCIPCSSAPSERVFSGLGVVLHKTAARMLPERVEGRLFLKMNMSLLAPI